MGETNLRLLFLIQEFEADVPVSKFNAHFIDAHLIHPWVIYKDGLTDLR